MELNEATVSEENGPFAAENYVFINFHPSLQSKDRGCLMKNRMFLLEPCDRFKKRAI
jgi:hypothetical protein